MSAKHLDPVPGPFGGSHHRGTGMLCRHSGLMGGPSRLPIPSTNLEILKESLCAPDSIQGNLLLVALVEKTPVKELSDGF